MTLYSADVTKLAKPVKKMQTAHKKLLSKTTKMPEPETHQVEVQLPKKLETKVGKKVGKKVKAVKKVVEEEEEEEEEEEKVKPPPKKRARKVPVPELTPESSPEPAPVPKKKRVRKAAPVPEPTPETTPEPTPEPPKKRVRKQAPKGEPPQWFQKYVEGVKKEEAVQKVEKVPAKQVKIEAQQAAQKSWDDGLTRDRVSNEVDNHMNRMYGMIFAKR